MQALGIDTDFWRGRRVFLTGHTGFVGGWLAFWLSELGAEVTGYALAPPTRPSFFEATGLAGRIASMTGDVRDGRMLAACLAQARPEIVFHLAALPLVRAAFGEPVETFATNVMGTAHLMEGLRGLDSLRAAAIFTSDKVYENREEGRPFTEDDRVGGREPYGGSKACAEIVVESFRRPYFAPAETGVATVRAGNIIGGGDWAADRLIPDAVRAFAARRPLVIRNPGSVRPWQHVLEPLRGTLLLAQALASRPEEFSGAWNFGPAAEDARPVSDLADTLTGLWGDGAAWQPENEDWAPYEAGHLSIDTGKAVERLSGRPLWPLDRALAASVDWYKAHLAGKDAATVTSGQIAAYRGAN